MGLRYIVMMSLISGLLTGCNGEQNVRQRNRDLDVELVKAVNNIGVENAIIRQHTLYPYHFTANAGELNELGQRDLAVLARHFAEHPGILNIQQGDVTDDLHKARVTYVLGRLKASGVEMDRMSVSEGMPGGPGMLSERVITILETEPQSRITTGPSTTGKVNR